MIIIICSTLFSCKYYIPSKENSIEKTSMISFDTTLILNNSFAHDTTITYRTGDTTIVINNNSKNTIWKSTKHDSLYFNRNVYLKDNSAILKALDNAGNKLKLSNMITVIMLIIVLADIVFFFNRK